MEQQGLGEMNDNGGRFADFCATGNLVTEGYTKRLGYHRNRSTTCASERSFTELFKMHASVAHGRQRTDAFKVRTRVRQ